MKIIYKEKEYELKWSFRALMIYENITKQTFNPKTLSDVLIFFYSILCSSAKGDTIIFDEFMDWVDQNPTSITEFSQWLAGVFNMQQTMNAADISEDEAKEAQEESEKN